MNRRSPGDASDGGITFHSPRAFWIGSAAISLGVLAHLPDFIATSEMGYHMAGMPMSGSMHLGMLLILAGLAMASYGLVPLSQLLRPSESPASEGIDFRAMDQANLTPQHWGLLFVLGIALIIDVMKPATLGFVMPGMREEYGLTTGEIALLPLVALTGTTLGSLIWGVLSDRIGRRAAILLAAVLFIGTSICGFMPSFAWNLLMCFLMGVSAGGMLPIVYALMAESIPAKKRGWLVVLHGGMGTVGGYLVASGLAALLEPLFSWRILWFVGLPTGVLLLVLNRWIPESPRFLLEHGRSEEAERVMARYGVRMTRGEGRRRDGPKVPAPESARRVGSGLASLFRGPLLLHTLTVGGYGLAWGLVNWGFLTFVPAILRDRGLDAAGASRMLFFSALIAVPGTILVAYLYGMWSSKKSMILFALLTALSLLAFAWVDPGSSGQQTFWLTPMMVALLVGSGGVIAMLSPYTAEVYPTQLRGTGSGFAAASSKVGGILAPPLVAIVLVYAPGFTLLALLVALPMLLSALLLAVAGVETRDRGLEDLVATTPGAGDAGGLGSPGKADTAFLPGSTG